MKTLKFFIRFIGLFALSLLFATSVVMATDGNPLQGTQDDIQQAIARSKQLQEALRSSNPDVEAALGLLNQLGSINTAPIDALLPSGVGGSAPMTGTMVNSSQALGDIMNGIDTGSPQSLQFLFARLQMEQAQSAKNGAMGCIQQIQDLQAQQKEAVEYIAKARALQTEAKNEGKATVMPGDMVDYFKTHNLSLGKSGNNYTYTREEWDIPIQSLTQYRDMLGMQTQQIMVYVQNYMGQYNSYLQGANSAIQAGNQTLQSLARGQSLFSSESGSRVDVAPIATSIIVGILLGMLTMWGIMRQKMKKQM